MVSSANEIKTSAKGAGTGGALGAAVGAGLSLATKGRIKPGTGAAAGAIGGMALGTLGASSKIMKDRKAETGSYFKRYK